MQTIKHNPTGLFPQYRCYTHAVEIRGDSRLLIISGLNGYLKDGKTMRHPQPWCVAGCWIRNGSWRLKP